MSTATPIKTAIVGTCYIDNNVSRDVAALWHKVCRAVNPDSDIITIDSASPVALPFQATFTFPDNIGHPFKAGTPKQDGSMRAMFRGLDLAREEGYDFAIFIECDIIVAKPVLPIAEKMDRCGVIAAFPFDYTYSFLENGIGFYDLRDPEIWRFIDNYDWRGVYTETSERRFEKMLEHELFTLPLRGCRNDHGLLTRTNIRQRFPHGIDYLTHCRDYGMYERLLDVNGVKL